MSNKDTQIRLNHQIIKFNGKDTILEVKNDYFNIDKVLIHMHKYDETKAKGQRITQEVDIYVNMSTALLLCNDILSGRITALLDVEKKKGEKYPKAIWQDLGGISATKLEEKEKYNISKGRALSDLKEGQKRRADGKSLSRVLKIAPGNKLPVIFTAENGAGEEDERGLIVPKYGLKPDNRVMVGLSYDQLKEFAIMLKLHIEAFITEKYVNYRYLVNKDGAMVNTEGQTIDSFGRPVDSNGKLI